MSEFDERMRDMLRKYLDEHQDSNAGDLASRLLACACVGCPRFPARCECCQNCRCKCRLEPHHSNMVERKKWAIGLARQVFSAGD